MNPPPAASVPPSGSSEHATDAAAASEGPNPLLYWFLVALCGFAVWQVKLAPFLLVGAFIARIALPRSAPRLRKIISWVSLGLALLAFVRFLIREAIPGIVQGGTRATQDAAVSKLREILAAEDALRRNASWDPDADGIGSAARLEELTGRAPLRGVRSLNPPVLQRYPVAIETSIGPAVELGGYLFVVCLPEPGGGFSARLSDSVDEELAERRFVAYAWPARPGQGLRDTFFLDEHENIKRASNLDYVGAAKAPACDAALAPEAASAWQDWKRKRPRRSLPGDRAPTEPAAPHP